MTGDDRRRLRRVLGRWDRLMRQWALTADEEGDLLGGSGLSGPLGCPESWNAAAMERRMTLLVDLGAGLEATMVHMPLIRAWLRRPIASQGRTPIELMGASIEWIVAFRRPLHGSAGSNS